ncbi:MAG TPA: Ger(x)C family spore germination protein [Syntrophomonadaceae bacterium]|nr:Ger(x)C family spore germination protein [Syntrophomonadaceae bacterium]
MLLGVLAICLLGGCWSKVEIEQMAFISLVGVDRADKEDLLVSFQIVNPRALARGSGGGSGGGGEPPVFVLSVTARTVPDALAKLAEESPRVVRFKQLSAIVLGEDLARSGVGQVMDFFARHWEMRRSIWVLVAKKSAQDVLLKGAPVSERVPGMAIKMEMERRAILSPTRYPVALGDFLTGLAREGEDAIASSVEIGPMQEKKPGGSGGKEEGGDTKEKATTGMKELVFSGAGVFRGEKLVAFLGPQETRGVRWFKGKVPGGVLTVPVKTQGTWASLTTDREITRVKPVVTKTGIRYDVEIMDEGFI